MAIYRPTIIDYRPFYIQPDAESLALDTLEEWGLVTKTNPFYSLPDAKETYSNDWYDEDGLDEYNEQLHYKHVDIEVSFYLKTIGANRDLAIQELNARLEAFFSRIRKGEMKIYDAYTQIGRQKVRYKSFRKEEFKARENWARIIFSVTFQVNDPLTKIIYRDYSLETYG